MADPIVVARKRSIAEIRLRRAVATAAQKFGITFKEPPQITKRQPALHSAWFVESVADFLEQVNQRANGYAVAPKKKVSTP